jgi:hypothetical protein
MGREAMMDDDDTQQYEHQRQWVRLQPHEVAKLVDEVDWYNFPMDLVRATEAKLKEKNHG